MFRVLGLDLLWYLSDESQVVSQIYVGVKLGMLGEEESENQ